MVDHQTFYGIKLTSQFGNPLRKYSEFVVAINKEEEKNGSYPFGIDSFPSAEESQLVLGFSIVLNKNTDFKELDKIWTAMVDGIPKKFKKLLVDLGEPDVIVMSGSY